MFNVRFEDWLSVNREYNQKRISLMQEQHELTLKFLEYRKDKGEDEEFTVEEKDIIKRIETINETLRDLAIKQLNTKF